MPRIALALILVLALPRAAGAGLVEVPPDDYLIFDQRNGQVATASHPIADLLMTTWVLRPGDGTTDLQLGVIDANLPAGSGYLPDVDAGTHLLRDPAIAFDAQSGLFLVVWSQDTGASGGALEVFGRFVDVTGLPRGLPFMISSAGVDPDDPRFDARQPAVASDGLGNFLVAWAADDDTYGAVDGQFDVYTRRVSALGAGPGPVVRRSSFGAGGAGLHPALAYMPWNGQFVLIFEGDSTPDPAVCAPAMYGIYLVAGAARTTDAPILLSALPAARRNSFADRNPSVAVDPLNRRVAVVWDQTPGPAPTARRIIGAMISPELAGVGFIVRDLDAEVTGPETWVRDPAITHTRIAGQFAVAWRESADPLAGLGQTLKILQYSEASGVDGPPLTFVTQPSPPGARSEVGPPSLVGGAHANARVFATWSSNLGLTAGGMFIRGQGFDADPATAAPPDVLPRSLALSLAPNPFNPQTSVSLSLPVAGRARVDVFDVRGRLVRQLVDEVLPAGTYQRTWSGKDDQGRAVASGVYLVRLRHPGGQRVVKASLVE